ncbi:hypothetical protein EDB80DRAFT_728429 [Ilyonectria destructans]|nr:hypothetical protein EDB80DRAFT_728429 [Ilyonectria destructans]
MRHFNMKRGRPWLKLRESIKKFAGGQDSSFAVVDYSKVFPQAVPLYQQRTVLVGARQQLRSIVEQLTVPLNFDIPLFERLYTSVGTGPGVAIVMLENSIRCIHPSGTFLLENFRTKD